MEFAYDDILNKRRPVHDGDVFSRRHPKMERQNRAKLFAPFSALCGFDEAVRSKETPYVPRRALDADETRALNRTLNWLARATRTGALVRQNRVRASVTFFEVCADRHHEGYGRLGLYHRITGVVYGVDPVARYVRVDDRRIPFPEIADIAIAVAI